MNILESYERALAMLRKSAHEFGEDYPRIASELKINGGACGDPHVERMIQSFAYLSARIQCRLDDSYPQFTESLLENLYPHYLRSFPSCSIARFAIPGEPQDGVLTIARGTKMKSHSVRGVKCQFKTAYHVHLAPIAITDVKFTPYISPPPQVRVAAAAGADLSIDIASTAGLSLAELQLSQLRIFIDGEPSFTAAVRDAIFMRAASAHVECGGNGRWTGLDTIPLRAAGFAEDEALIPYTARSQPAYRLLSEYFAAPEKFNFFDIDWGRLREVLPAGCRRCTLHLALQGVRADSNLARTLAAASADNFLLHCAPVVNLFSKVGVPVSISQTAPDYALLADSAHPHAYEIHSVDKATLVLDTTHTVQVRELQPLYGLHHGQTRKDGHYWVTRRDPIVAQHSPGHECRITLVDGELQLVDSARQTLSIELTCSNRDLPTSLSHGAPDDLSLSGTAGTVGATFLRKPSPPWRIEADNGAHWRLIAHLSLNLRPLTETRIEAFRNMLSLYDLPKSPSAQRQIDGIVDIRYQVVMDWIPGKPSAALMPGVRISMTIDEDAFVGSSIHLFAQVVDHFFGLYGQINVFTQLSILSKKSGEEIYKCPPRSGAVSLV